jgi:NAD(P)-dependent dehydrogenase (short-subunit alcohol dehydrogenase family)
LPLPRASPPTSISSYSASKAAAWALTNWLRTALRAQGTQVLGVHVGLVDTDMTTQFALPKLAPAEVVGRVLAALQSGRSEVLVDDWTRQVKAGLSAEEGYLDFDPNRAALTTKER